MVTPQEQYNRTVAHLNMTDEVHANCEECGAAIPVEVSLCDNCLHADDDVESISDSQGVCKDCGNGTLNNEINPAFDFVYDERNDVDVLVCLRCGSTHLEVL